MLFCRRVTTWDKFFRDLVDLPNLFVQQNITGWPSIFDKHFLFLVWRNFLRQTVFLRQTILKKYIDWWPQAMIMRFLCRHFSSKRAFCRIPNILQRLTAPRMIDRFGRIRCQKKRKDANYQLLLDFVQRYFVVDELQAGKYSFSSYVCYTLDVLFWWAVYLWFILINSTAWLWIEFANIKWKLFIKFKQKICKEIPSLYSNLKLTIQPVWNVLICPGKIMDCPSQSKIER